MQQMCLDADIDAALPTGHFINRINIISKFMELFGDMKREENK